jgi:pimeloyl-ACP methyl ester carboxylesterase
MRTPPGGLFRRLSAATVVAAILTAAPGCSYLQWRQTKHDQRQRLKKNPTELSLEREYAPQNCYGLVGRIKPTAHPDPLLAAAFSHARHSELVGSRDVDPASGYFAVLLPAGDYDLVFFADLNRDGFYGTDEVVGRTPVDSPVRMEKAGTRDGIVVPAPEVEVDLEDPSSATIAVHVKVDPQPFVVKSVEDPVFSAEMGELGVYQPTRFLARTQRWMFSVGVPDFTKTQVVLVHGIDGTPRDFRTLIARIDPSRYHVWLFYYPSGLGLDQLGTVLAHAVGKIVDATETKDLRLAIVAHSMGGLVGLRAVHELCRGGRPPYLRMYASFDTPYGGVEAVSGAVKRGTELVPSWIDVAAGSPFLTRLHETSFPKDLPFHLFFGWGKAAHHGPGPAGDGTITLPSQLDPRAQAAATAMSGFGETHVGILSDPKALEDLVRALEEATADAS